MFVGAFVICLQIKPNIPSDNGSLVTAVKPKDEYRIYVVAKLFHVLQKYDLNKTFQYPI